MVAVCRRDGGGGGFILTESYLGNQSLMLSFWGLKWVQTQQILDLFLLFGGIFLLHLQSQERFQKASRFRKYCSPPHVLRMLLQKHYYHIKLIYTQQQYKYDSFNMFLFPQKTD